MGLTALLRSQPARRHFIFVPYRHYASKEFDASRKESLLKHLRERLRKDDELNGYTKETVKGILDGKVRILTGPECELRFKCTACGECCRHYGASLTLTPYDIWRMSRSPALIKQGVTSTTSLARSLSTALVLSPGDECGTPLCRLRTVQRAGPGREPDDRCAFAIPAGRRNADGTVAVRRNVAGRAALVCMLGPAHMPTKCAGFPVSRGVDEAQGFYFEVPECEGLEQDAAESQPLSAYIQSNGLAQAWEQSDWFRALKSETVAAVLFPAAHASSWVASRAFGILASAWFDFDSLPGSRLETWEDAKARIESQSRLYIDALGNVAQDWGSLDRGGISDLKTMQADYWGIYDRCTRHLLYG